jgi:hypothetical protein
MRSQASTDSPLVRSVFFQHSSETVAKRNAEQRQQSSEIKKISFRGGKERKVQLLVHVIELAIPAIEERAKKKAREK